MFGLDGIQIAMLIIALIAVALFVEYTRRRRPTDKDKQTGPEYVWLAFPERYGSPFSLAFAGAETDEATELTYRGAYLLLTADLRMELTMVEFFIESRGFLPMPRARVVKRLTYTTEVFQPYRREIRSLEDFGRYAPYRTDSLWMMKLSVHPDDAAEAIRVLEHADIAVEMASGPQPWWHAHNEML